MNTFLGKRVEMFGEEFGLETFKLIKISLRRGYLRIYGENKNGLKYKVYDSLHCHGFSIDDGCITITTTKEILTLQGV